MIQKVKNYVLHLTCLLALLGGMTACDDFKIDLGGGNEDEPGTETPGNGNGNGNEETPVGLVRCWHLVEFCGVAADADIYIDFAKDGKFVIYQRTESLEFVVFNGTYTIDEENSIVSGVYDDGVEWLTSYSYVVDEENKTLTMTSVETPSEVAVYKESKAPASATVKTRGASVSDVKPL